MKRLKLSFLLILIGSALLLSAVGESAESLNPKEAKPQSTESQLQQEKAAKQQNPTVNSLNGAQFLHSQTNHTTTNSQTSKQEAKAEPPTDSSWWFNLFLVIFTACLVDVGIAQVFVYKKQARYMRRGLKLTKQAAEAAQKARKLLSTQIALFCLSLESR